MNHTTSSTNVTTPPTKYGYLTDNRPAPGAPDRSATHERMRTTRKRKNLTDKINNAKDVNKAGDLDGDFDDTIYGGFVGEHNHVADA